MKEVELREDDYVELELRILGTELAITTANEIKAEREREYEAYKNGSSQLHGVSGS